LGFHPAITQIKGGTMNKEKYISKSVEIGTTLVNLLTQLPNVHKAYFDKGLGSGGSNEITQADLDNAGINLSDFTSLITLFEQLNNFASNQPVVQGDYISTLNKIRNDW
jgi:hypothetical protein